MKKLLVVALAALLAAALAIPAFAHCARRGRQGASVSLCAAQDCTLAGTHSHDGKAYAAHYYGDGHSYHDYCALEGCTDAGYHAHDDLYCFGHTYNDGHDYHDYCGIADCTLTGYHEHNGSYCFAHTVNDGHSYHRKGRGCRS